MNFPALPFQKPAAVPKPEAMKLLIVVVTALALNSCNTLIGLGRDTKEGYQWTKGKMQGSGEESSADAPVY